MQKTTKIFDKFLLLQTTKFYLIAFLLNTIFENVLGIDLVL